MISALVLTYNEENILDECLTALSFTDAIVVFDSFSNDKTIEIAETHNAIIHQRKFDNYASQRNAALEIIPEGFDWILMVDADEIVTSELRAEVMRVINRGTDHTMFRVRRKDMFQGKWIKQSSGYPTWFPRLFKAGQVIVEREINEEYKTTGTEGLLREHLLHYPFNKGMSWWFEKHNRYSQMEAQKMLKETKEPIDMSGLRSKNPIIRRKTQKKLSYKLPFRPQLIFVALYFFRGGFLNGKAGYEFCKLRKVYEWMIKIKYNELKNRNFEN